MKNTIQHHQIYLRYTHYESFNSQFWRVHPTNLVGAKLIRSDSKYYGIIGVL